MTTYEVLPFKPDDYVEAMGVSSFSDVRASAQTCARYPAISGFVDGRLAGCAGVIIPWRGRGTAWAVYTALGREHARFIRQATVTGLLDIVREQGMRRLEAEAVREHRAGWRWLEVLGRHLYKVGMTPEWRDETGRHVPTHLPLYGPQGEDFVRYVWLRA